MENSVNSDPSRGIWRYAWSQFKKNKLALAAAIFLTILILAAALAPFITPTSYEDQDYLDKAYSFPNSENWLGVDSVGRDYFTRIIYGARVSLGVGLLASFAALMIGMPLGVIGGYWGGVPDWFVMRAIEITAVIPPLLIGLVLAIITRGGIFTIVLIVAAFFWKRVARLVRGQVKSVKNENYVLVSKGIGASPFHIFRKHLIPNTVAEILVGLVLVIPRAIMLEASLSFLGVGIPPPVPSWGKMISDSLYYIYYYWHLPLFPTLMLALTILSFAVVGDGLRDAFDPSLKGT